MESVSNLKEISTQIESLIQLIDKYQASKPQVMAITHLEEALLWSNVLVSQVPLKPENKVPAEPSNIN